MAESDTEIPAAHQGRWHDYVLGRDDSRYGFSFDELVNAAARQNEPSLYVMGLGFDARAAIALERAASLLPKGSRIIAVPPRRQKNGTSREARFQRENSARVVEIAKECSHELEIIEPNPTAVDERFNGVWLARTLQGRPDWNTRHVVVDISSLPSPIFFALIKGWLAAKNGELELQVVAAASQWLDDYVTHTGTMPPQLIPGFNEHGQVEAVQDETRIWIPVLGKGRTAQLDAIAEALVPDEICPVLPLPADDPRRGDALVFEYNEFLFATHQADPRNFIYADAANPFDLYRSLLSISQRYRKVLEKLGKPAIVPSIHGSKLLSLGVLLGAMEAKLSVINAGGARVHLSTEVDDAEIREAAAESQLTCLWLNGEPYCDRPDSPAEPTATEVGGNPEGTQFKH
ncbi:hypothetical protein DE4576_04647 [Mycobacterium marinum]|uniref:hypothetical protein n=1 Tax=Mycobacterium marinum TaxID=1781 RepID=UPI000E3E0B33|nr:hypothetical protein [Mycobacterium marinum]RFZ63449.1 hypothetical protein DE4576_04647 [Mycobacterium marinum]